MNMDFACSQLQSLILLLLCIVVAACSSNDESNVIVQDGSDQTATNTLEGVELEPQQARASFPFPTKLGPGKFCAPLNGADPEDARKSYHRFKSKAVTSEGALGFRRVHWPDYLKNSPGPTNSEGIAYGMTLAVTFDDQELFDDLYNYALRWPSRSGSGLMDWYINAEGTEACPGEKYCGSATDADEDMAFALVMAARQWGGRGALSRTYQEFALRQIRLLKAYNIDTGFVVKPGDGWGGADQLNLSHFAPAYYEIFGRYSGDKDFWSKVIDVNYKILFNTLNEKNGNQDNGLLPLWSMAAGYPKVPFKVIDEDGVERDAPVHFNHFASRALFRIAQHYCWTGDIRARNYLNKVNNFFNGVGVENIAGAYALNGGKSSEQSGASGSVLGTFVGVAALIDPKLNSTSEHIYKRVAALEMNEEKVSSYYELSWNAMALAYMSGIYFDMTKHACSGAPVN